MQVMEHSASVRSLQALMELTMYILEEAFPETPQKIF